MKKNIIFELKKSKLLRILCFPFVNLIRYSRLITYPLTKDSREVKKMKNTHLGERCFIIGNGPSLKAEDWNFFEMSTVLLPTESMKYFPILPGDPHAISALIPIYSVNVWGSLQGLNFLSFFSMKKPENIIWSIRILLLPTLIISIRFS